MTTLSEHKEHSDQPVRYTVVSWCTV